MLSIIQPGQNYFVAGRLISDNVTLFWNLLDLSSSLTRKTGLISIDQEKDFDRVQHQYQSQTSLSKGSSSSCYTTGGENTSTPFLVSMPGVLLNPEDT